MVKDTTPCLINESLIKSFDRLRTNGKGLIPFVVSLSNALLNEVEGHRRNPLVQSFLGLLTILCVLTLCNPAFAMMEHGNMQMDDKGMIMNANTDQLPKDCQKISGDVNLTIRAGHEYAEKFNGKMYAFDNQEWDVPPCARVNITFINDDEIRHQLMIHGLPGYLYPQGMFHLELYGAGELKASLIVPAMKKTYLVHCELPQHMEKGMKAQLIVDGGDGDLPSIPGLTKPVKADVYPVDWTVMTTAVLLASMLLGCVILLVLFLKLKGR
ncbi:hypothetical protein MCAMS1_02047 [biofilm metagenome]